MIFVDGLGLGNTKPDSNPIYRGHSPFLAEVLDAAQPLDAGLGCPGLPQSATGQASLLTGQNIPRLIGRHKEGLPGPSIIPLVQKHNLFSALKDIDRTSWFANAYFTRDAPSARYRRHPSVTTVATLSALGQVAGPDELLANRAIYHDLTREALRPQGYTGPIISPEAAGDHLAELTATYHFTLFEFFQTDIVGHKGTEDEKAQVLNKLDRFLARLNATLSSGPHSWMLCSDHGNIEDARVRTHTHNPIPLYMQGPHAEAFADCADLCDIAPTIIHLLSP